MVQMVNGRCGHCGGRLIWDDDEVVCLNCGRAAKRYESMGVHVPCLSPLGNIYATKQQQDWR